MAFPTVAARATFNSGGTSNTSHSVTIPSPSNGDRVVLTLGGASGVTYSITGWTQVFSATYQSDGSHAAFYKDCNGTEGASVTVTLSGSAKLGATSYRLSAGTFDPAAAPEASALAQGNSANPDPASLSPSWGALDTLWIACYAAMVNGGSTSAYPTSYSNGQEGLGSGANAPTVASAERALNASSENPSSFTNGTSNNWSARVIAIKPAPSGGGPIVHNGNLIRGSLIRGGRLAA